MEKHYRKDRKTHCRVCGRLIVFGIGHPKRRWVKRKKTEAFHDGRMPREYELMEKEPHGKTRRLAIRILEQGCFTKWSLEECKKTFQEAEEVENLSKGEWKLPVLVKLTDVEFYEIRAKVLSSYAESCESIANSHVITGDGRNRTTPEPASNEKRSDR